MSNAEDVQTSKPASSKGSGWVVPVVGLAILAAVALAGIYVAGRSDRPIEVTLDGDNGLTMKIAAHDNFVDILRTAFETDEGTVRAVLAGRGYYHYTDGDLVNKIATLTSVEPPNEGVVVGMRRLLWDQRGPFIEPASLRGVDARLMSAFEKLDEEMRKAGQSSPFLTGLWKDSLEYRGLFKTRVFNADVQLLFIDGPETREDLRIYVCPGNEFAGKDMTVFAEGNPSPSVTGRTISDPTRLNCQNSAQKLEDFFAGRTARLGMDRRTFAALYSPGEANPSLPPRLEAKFLVHPVGFAGR